VIQTEEQVKLIDLGAVRRIDDEDSAIWGTVGYQAPEIAAEGPSVASDIYTVGRALAVMAFPFDFAKRYYDRLPDAVEVPLLAQHPSFARLLLRATNHDPDQRFDSADDMITQMSGVLREVLAAQDGRPRPEASTLFTAERRTFVADQVRDPSAVDLTQVPVCQLLVAALPVPQVDTADPAAGLLATLTATEPTELVEALQAAPERTVELRLRLVRAFVESGDLESARTELAALTKEEPHDWRVAYHAGLLALADGQPATAARAFDQVYSAVPGEAAPKLALAACAECAGELPAAARYYQLVWRTDHSYVSAAFGLARVRLRQGDPAGAIEVLEAVPSTSSHHLAALVTAVLARTKGRKPEELTDADLLAAGDRLATLDLDAERSSFLAVEVLSTALSWVQSRGADNGVVG
jgi:serine/threonine-protein kinase PknG